MVRFQSRIFWLLVLLGHAVSAAGWWSLMPHGFPADHRRFWVNEVLPPAVVATVLATLVAARRRGLAVVRAVLLGLAMAWLAVAASGRIVFPVSFALRWLIPLASGIVVGVAAWSPALRAARWPSVLTPACAGIGVALGAWLPLSQRAEEPSNHTAGTDASVIEFTPLAAPVPPQRLRTCRVEPRNGLLTFERGRYVMYVQPLLSFRDHSPDRCWTSLAPRDQRGPLPRTLVGFPPRKDDVEMIYRDFEQSVLDVDDEDDGTTSLTASTALAEPVYSHLNTFCEFEFAGHRDLAVTFSPCPAAPVAVTYCDYPVGEPSRFAYLGGDGTFRVVQASSGEKGPFKTLAEGPLKRGDLLVMTLSDQGRPVVRIELWDWSQQVSTALSPTAGWGVPQNAIEFSRDTRDAKSPASFFITLAGTSVGRGWDSVGHAGGQYLNRVRVKWLEDPPATQRARGPS